MTDKAVQGAINITTQTAFLRRRPAFHPRQASMAVMTAGTTAKAPSKTAKAKAETNPAKTLSFAAKPKKNKTEVIAAKSAAQEAIPQATRSAGRPLAGRCAVLRLAGALSVMGVSGSEFIGLI